MAAPSPLRQPLARRAAVPVLVVALLALQLVAAAPARADAGALSVDSPPAKAEPDAGSSTTVRFTVTLARTEPGAVTVDYRTVDGTARGGRDYVARSGSLFFGGSDTTAAVDVTIRGDNLDEADEAFTLELLNPFNATLAAATGTATIIDNDDPPVLSISNTTVAEGNAGESPAAFVVTLSERSGQTVTVNYAAAADTATSPADFTPAAGTLNFPPGTFSQIISVPVAGDTLDEPNEQFRVNLSAALNATLGTPGFGVGTITDDDGPPALSIDDAASTEPADAAFTVRLSTASAKTVTVQASTSDATAAAPGDYSATTETVTIPAGETSATFTVPVDQDTTDEPDETFLVTLSQPEGAGIEDGIAVGTIRDDDAGPEFSIGDVAATPEGTSLVPTNFDFTITRTGSLPSDSVVVNYTVSGGTATASDFIVSSGAVTFLPTDTTKTARVSVAADALPEGAETFTVTISQGSGPAVTFPDAEGVSVILNDDGAPATVEILDRSVVEGTGGSMTALFTVRVSAGFGQAVGMTYTTQDATARAGSDYAPTAGTLLFPFGGSNEATISVSIATDALDEDDETFTVELSNVSNAVLKDDDGTAVGTITDDDDPPVVDVESIGIDEGNSGEAAGRVGVTLSGPSGKTVTVAYTTAPGTAVAGVDYAAPAGATLTFAPGEVRKEIPVAAVGDGLDEIDEAFTVSLASETNATVGTRTGTVTIRDDDDQPTLTVSAAPAAEPADAGATGQMNFTAELSAESGKDVTFDYATADESATAGSDYQAASGSVTIPAGDGGASIAVTILGDSIAEPDETLKLALSSVTNANPPAEPAAGTILDNDGPPVLSIAALTVAEGDIDNDAVLTVTRLGDTGVQVTVDFATANGTATAPADYTAASGTLTFDAGVTVQSVPITIEGDTTDEPDETFTVALSNAAGAPDVTIDPDAGTATVTVLDDDGPAVSITAPSPVVEGNTGTVDAVFTVSLSAAPAQEVRVDYASASGSATSPDDFTAVAGTLVFPANAGAPQTVAVPVIGDTDGETDEDFALTLSNPANATLAVASASATIDDDDRSLLAVTDASVVEGNAGATTATFTVSLTPALDEGVTIDYATNEGTATAPSDFTGVSGKLFFAAGETTRTITVTVAGDTDEEPDETFGLKLSGISAPAAAAFADDTATGTIVDDDRPPVVTVASSGSAADLAVTEGTGTNSSVTFQVRLSGARSFPVAVDYAAGGGTAARAADYTPTSGRLTFAPGEQVKAVSVEVKGDSRFEVSETFGLVLSGPDRASVGPSSTFAVILDDDQAGYVLAATDGGIFNYGDAAFFGSTGDIRLNQPIVGVASHPSGRGYWLVASDGGIFAFGEAGFHGSTGNLRLNKPIVGMAATPSGEGYWLVASDGGIFAFGDAGFHGSTGAIALNRPVVGMAATPSGEGYWLVATDGGIFAFGDAGFYGSTGAIALNRPVVGMAATPSGEGYWLVATDGGIFAFGNAAFHGSTGALRLNRPVVGMTATPAGAGYWLVADDGGIFAFGDAPFLGSAGSIRLNRPIVGMADL